MITKTMTFTTYPTISVQRTNPMYLAKADLHRKLTAFFEDHRQEYNLIVQVLAGRASVVLKTDLQAGLLVFDNDKVVWQSTWYGAQHNHIATFVVDLLF